MARRAVFSGRLAHMRAFDLIVRCRRGHDVAAWQELRALVEGDVQAFCAGSDTRWIVSVCDTYADYAEPAERAAAMLIVLLVDWEKLAWSLRLVSDQPAPGLPDRAHCNAPLWDGVMSLDLYNRTYDMPRNLIRRLLKALRPFPHLAHMCRAVLERLVEAKHSTPGLLNGASVHRDLCADILKALRSSP